MNRLRLAEFVDWISETRDTYRNVFTQGDAPFAQKLGDRKERTYDGSDLLAWCLFVQLRRAGLPVAVAGQAVRLSGAVGQFFAAMERGEDVSDWHVIVWFARRERADGARLDEQNQTHGTSESVAEILRAETAGYGGKIPTGKTRLGIVALVTVPVLPCFHRCQTTAEDKGFEMRGPALIEMKN